MKRRRTTRTAKPATQHARENARLRAALSRIAASTEDRAVRELVQAALDAGEALHESPMLAAAKELVTTCAHTGQTQEREFATDTPFGRVKLTLRAVMLLHAPGTARIVRPS